MAYKPKPTRQENEDVIRMLADRYPKCFFNEPKLRRPLKLDIIADLQKDEAILEYELIAAGVEWYQSNFGYLHSLQTGAKRLDLNGREVSTVTEQEYIAALANIKLAHQKRNANAAATVQALHAAGRIPDDQVRKLDAPPMTKTTAKATIAPELTKLYEAVIAASTTLSGSGDPGLRAAMAAAALNVVRQEAQRVIESLNGE
jgi:sRNA-binding protein